MRPIAITFALLVGCGSATLPAHDLHPTREDVPVPVERATDRFVAAARAHAGFYMVMFDHMGDFTCDRWRFAPSSVDPSAGNIEELRADGSDGAQRPYDVDATRGRVRFDLPGGGSDISDYDYVLDVDDDGFFFWLSGEHRERIHFFTTEPACNRAADGARRRFHGDEEGSSAAPLEHEGPPGPV